MTRRTQIRLSRNSQSGTSNCRQPGKLVVAKQLRNISYTGHRGVGAFSVWGDSCQSLRCNCRVCISESVIATFRLRSSEHLSKQQRMCLEAQKLRIDSCSSLDIVHVAAGVCDAFVDCSKEGHERDCDIAAATVIIRESGGDVYDANTLKSLELGAPTLLSITDRRPVIAACTSDLARNIFETI
ncbi:MAG: hypothetical protein KDA89_25490 [Planctomycetaceae bacterium]|nr:hypothetical protein [Planctomycetaceae bacterium]